MAQASIERKPNETIIRIPGNISERLLHFFERLVNSINKEPATKPIQLPRLDLTQYGEGLDEDDPETQRIINELSDEIKASMWEKVKHQYIGDQGTGS